MKKEDNIIDLGIDINDVALRRKPRSFEEYVQITGITEELIGNDAFKAIENWFKNTDLTKVKAYE